MTIQIIPKDQQAYGAFNGGQIVENKPIGFPQDGGNVRPYSNLFYWAYAEANVDSTIELHPHQGFEIMSFVLKGTIRHFDTKLNDWKPLEKGDAQIIRAGNGISHAEFMAKDSAMFQIWLDPNLAETLQMPASYNDYRAADFPITQNGDVQVKNYIGQNGLMELHTAGIEIQEWTFGNIEQALELDSSKIYSIYALEGDVTIGDEALAQDGFAIVQDIDILQLKSNSKARLFVIASQAALDYQTYAQRMQARMS